MIVARRFDCDTNDPLHWLQHDCYFNGQAGALYRACRKRYLDAVRLLATPTPLSQLIEQRESYDHRVLQEAYHAIAAFHRFSVGMRAEQTLFETAEQWRSRLKQEWLATLDSEVTRLAQKDEICVAVLTAVAYQNQPEGRAAEEHLATMLGWEHGELSLDRWRRLHSSNETSGLASSSSDN